MNKTPFKHAIALTGGIATGKSTVCSLLKLHGFLTIDADSIAHKLLDENSATIALMFGEKYVKEGKVLRKELGKIIFSNEKEKLKLEAFIHPLIKVQIEKEAAIFEAQGKPYFIDIPLFFEKMHYPIQRSVVIYTPKAIQVQRLMKRDTITQEEALQKISNQMDIEAKKELASFVVNNSGSLKDLQKEVEALKDKLL